MDFMTFGFGVLIDPRGGGAKGPKKGVRMIFFSGYKAILKLNLQAYDNQQRNKPQKKQPKDCGFGPVYFRPF